MGINWSLPDPYEGSSYSAEELDEGAREAWERERTCAECGEVGEEPLPGEVGDVRWCLECLIDVGGAPGPVAQ